jgi:hypothetical protein
MNNAKTMCLHIKMRWNVHISVKARKFVTKITFIMVVIRPIVTSVTMATTTVMDTTGFYGYCISALALMSPAPQALPPNLGHCKDTSLGWPPCYNIHIKSHQILSSDSRLEI